MSAERQTATEDGYDNIVRDVVADVNKKKQGLSRRRFDRIRCIAEVARVVNIAALSAALLNI